MVEDELRASIIQEFHSIPGLGLSRAEALYEAGYTSISLLKKATPEDLSKVKGFTISLAEHVLSEVSRMDTKAETAKEEAPAEEKKEVAPQEPGTAEKREESIIDGMLRSAKQMISSLLGSEEKKEEEKKEEGEVVVSGESKEVEDPPEKKEEKEEGEEEKKAEEEPAERKEEDTQ